jgi:S1-C subfamily serine protease
MASQAGPRVFGLNVAARRVGAVRCSLTLGSLVLLCSAVAGWSQEAKPQSDPAEAAQSTAKPLSAGGAETKMDQGAVANSDRSADTLDSKFNAALAPVVYPDDQTPEPRGYQYTFFGNAFFINEQGYLLTVAHVLETFSDGGQPSILVKRPDAPPRLVKVSVIAQDPAHDVAILRAAPNPFTTGCTVAFVPLSASQPVRGESVLAVSLRPKHEHFALSFELPREDSSRGTVLSFESTQLAKSAPPADVFLLSHPVVKGQSGSPVLDTETQAVIGLVEGLWLRGTYGTMSKASPQPDAVPGAAIPVQYAIALLKQNGVTWHTAAPLTSAPDASLLQ